MAIPHGRSPTGMVPVTMSVAASITATVPPRPVVTKTVLPSGEIARPIGRPSSLMVFATTWSGSETTVTVPPFSWVT